MLKPLAHPMYALYATMGILYSFIVIILQPQNPAVFFLFTLSIAIVVIRLRFDLRCRWIMVDIFGYLVLLIFFEVMALLIIPTLIMMLYYDKYYSVFIAALLWFGFFFLDVTILVLIVFMLFSGLFLNRWHLEVNRAKKNVDAARIKIYDLEREQDMILQTQDELSRVSILSERDRIAQKLHDDLGHELTGALLALRALASNQENLSEDAMFSALKTRLEGAVGQLKDTVQNTHPDTLHGFDAMKHLIERFTYADIYYQQDGDIGILSAHHWHVLLGVLKEALTNIQKHSQAKRVDVELFISQTVVRLMVKNDGVDGSNRSDGLGLKYMRRRIEALGGSMSVQSQMFFILVCVLPIDKEVSKT